MFEDLPIGGLDSPADVRTNGIHRPHEVLDDMEMVDDDRDIGEDLVHGIPVGLPHVHRDELEVLLLLHAPQRADDRLLGAFLREFEDAPLGPVDLHEHAPVVVFEMDLIDAQNRRRDEAVLRHQNVRVVVEDRCDGGDAGVVAVGDGGEGLVQGVPLYGLDEPFRHPAVQRGVVHADQVPAIPAAVCPSLDEQSDSVAEVVEILYASVLLLVHVDGDATAFGADLRPVFRHEDVEEVAVVLAFLVDGVEFRKVDVRVDDCRRVVDTHCRTPYPTNILRDIPPLSLDNYTSLRPRGESVKPNENHL